LPPSLLYLWGALNHWKVLKHVPAVEILCHRITWALLFLVILITLQNKWRQTFAILKNRKKMSYLTASSLLVGANWFLYIWSVNNGQILQSSLGYYINPLLNILFGILLFKEKLSKLQWCAVFLALTGVSYLTITNGVMPTLALAIAITFCVYGAIHKTIAEDAIIVLMVETFILTVPALIYLLMIPNNAFLHSDVLTSTMLAGAGVVTALPLLLFVYATDKIKFTTIGLTQYLAPTGQFLCGVFQKTLN
jgi:chloramphenicol-sensitive protein RarD